MFLYTSVMLGRLSRAGTRVWLGLAGIASVGFGMAAALGLSSALGFPYTPIHAILPFLCLGNQFMNIFS